MVTKKIKTIGIDIDWYSTINRDKHLASIRKRCLKVGVIIHDYPSKQGHHLRVRLSKQVSFKQSILLRYALGDDSRRLFFDIRRWWLGSNIIDVLWDVKRVNKINLNNDSN